VAPADSLASDTGGGLPSVWAGSEVLIDDGDEAVERARRLRASSNSLQAIMRPSSPASTHESNAHVTPMTIQCQVSTLRCPISTVDPRHRPYSEGWAMTLEQPR